MEKMIGTEIRQQLVDVFKGLDKPVQILFFSSKMRACEYCEHTLQLLKEITELSETIYLDAYDIDENPDIAAKYHVELIPGIVLAAKDSTELIDYGIRFAGIPAGHEFSSLISGILLVSKRDSGLSKEGRDFLAKLTTPLLLQVFVTTTCSYCPQAVTLAHQMAMESELVQSEMVEAMEFSELSSQYGVSGVPHTVINQGKGELVGAVPESALVDELKQVVDFY
jgi:glutaredoxin-like protein